MVFTPPQHQLMDKRRVHMIASDVLEDNHAFLHDEVATRSPKTQLTWPLGLHRKDMSVLRAFPTTVGQTVKQPSCRTDHTNDYPLSPLAMTPKHTTTNRHNNNINNTINKSSNNSNINSNINNNSNSNSNSNNTNNNDGNDNDNDDNNNSSNNSSSNNNNNNSTATFNRASDNSNNTNKRDSPSASSRPFTSYAFKTEVFSFRPPLGPVFIL